MKKLSKISKKQILSKYIKYVDKKGKRPKSIEKFCSKTNIDLHSCITNFKKISHIENYFWSQLFKATDKALSHEQFESKTHHILSFYFTLFENLSLNQSFIYYIQKDSNAICIAKQLKKASSNSLDKLTTHQTSLLDKLPFNISGNIQKEIMFSQLLSIYNFWKYDDSEDKESTDAFIEKSVRLMQDLTHALPTESIFDYAKFLFKHKNQFV